MVFLLFMCLTLRCELLLNSNNLYINWEFLQTAQLTKEDRVFGIIDNVLKQAFGEPATRLIYQYLEHRYSLGQCEISEKIDVFANCLEDCLNDGAYQIENSILNDMRSAFGLETGISFQIAVPEECESALQLAT